MGISDSQNKGDVSVNNYARPEGQNVGNFVTDRSSSRVLAPPGGKSSVHFFGETTPSATVIDRTRRSMSPPIQKQPVAEKPEQRPAVKEGLSLAHNDNPPKPAPAGERGGSNSCSRPGERQNVKEGLSLAHNDYPPNPPPVGERGGSNNYSRPGQQQNVGNYITGRNTSRVLAPPGGGSSITFG